LTTEFNALGRSGTGGGIEEDDDVAVAMGALFDAAVEVGKLEEVAAAPGRSHGLGGDGEAI